METCFVNCQKNTANQNSSVLLVIIFLFLFLEGRNQGSLTIFRMGGGGAKKTPTSFSPVTSTNVGISPKNFLTFNSNPFDRLV